jgi:hypothetical protein
MRWCRFTGININCLITHTESLFGGAQDGTVHILLETTSDNGASIQFTGMPAFNYFDNPGIHKHLVATNFISTYQQPGSVVITGYADFDVPGVIPPVNPPAVTIPSTWAINPPTPPSVEGSFWDTDFWSSGTPSFGTYQGWQNVSAFGYAVTVLIRFSQGSDIVGWRSTALRFYEAGSQ